MEPKLIEKIDRLRFWGKEIAIIPPIHVALYTMSPIRHYPLYTVVYSCIQLNNKKNALVIGHW